MKELVGININANATITMTAIQYLELQAQTQKWSMGIEQQRIIKLLEDDRYMIESDRIYAIELITGEQK